MQTTIGTTSVQMSVHVYGAGTIRTGRSTLRKVLS